LKKKFYSKTNTGPHRKTTRGRQKWHKTCTKKTKCWQ